MNQLQQMLKQAQKMQAQMSEMQDKMALIEVEGSAGAGMVVVTMTCGGDLRRVKIDSSLLSEDEKEVLEDLIVAAHNDVQVKVKQRVSEEMSKITGGLPLPAGMQMPF